MHYAEQNSRNLTAVRSFLEGLGYRVTACWVDYGTSASSLDGTYWLPEQRKDTEEKFYIPSDATASPGRERTGDQVQHAFNVWFDNFRQGVLRPEYAKQAVVLRLIERVRDLAPEADLPSDFLNPIEVLAERLRTNILSGPREFNTPPPLSAEGDDMPI